MAKNILRKVKPETTEKPHKIGDDELVFVQITKKEVQTLFDGARAFDLMKRVCDANCEEKIIVFEVLFDLLADEVFEVAHELQDRFHNKELEAVGI